MSISVLGMSSHLGLLQQAKHHRETVAAIVAQAPGVAAPTPVPDAATAPQQSAAPAVGLATRALQQPVAPAISSGIGRSRSDALYAESQTDFGPSADHYEVVLQKLDSLVGAVKAGDVKAVQSSAQALSHAVGASQTAEALPGKTGLARLLSAAQSGDLASAKSALSAFSSAVQGQA